MAIADLYGPQLPPMPEIAPMGPTEQPAAPQAAAPVPVSQRTIGGFVQAKQNDPANWVTLTNQGAVRNLPIVEQLQNNLQRAIAQVYGNGYRAQVYSGGQPALGSGQPRVGSTRHDNGMAADLRVMDPQGNTVTGDKLALLGRHWLENRLGGVGLEMRGGGIHLDMHQGRAPIWTYGPVSPAQAALVREFGGRAPSVATAGTTQVVGGSARPQMAANAPQQVAQPGLPPPPMLAPPMPDMTAPAGIASMYAMDGQRRAEQARRSEEEAAMERRRALFEGRGPFG